VIYDESDKLSVLKSILKNQLHVDEKEFPARQVAFYISNAKNALITAKNYEKEVDSSIKEVVFNAYIKYEENLRQNNAIDFDDILVKTLAILQIPQILEGYQEQYKYLMVDEYQDTNAPQYEIVKLLAAKYRNLAVVGDDSQSIYSWR
jgi:DNA helicase-2/ATP-dependent DNA helicase PcrA